MGWCYAFGPQIRAGCDHAMVAGRDSCSCADCGAVCRGLFPGCSSVWAAGPRKVTLTRPTKEPGGLLPVRSPSTLSPPTAAARPAPAQASAVDDVASTDAPGDQFETRGLRIDMQLLLWKVEQLRQAAAPGEQLVQAAKEIKAAAAALPEQVREAVSAALEMQRQSILASFADMQRKIVVDIAQVREMLRRAQEAPGRSGAPGAPGGTGSRSASVSDLDVRFQWLVDSVSERFVTLGNELARIERQLVDDRQWADARGAASSSASPAASSSASPAATRPPSNGTNGSGTVAPVAGTARA